mgnify:CR=1 FL=1
MGRKREPEKLTMEDLSPEDQRELSERALRSAVAQMIRAPCELCGTPNKELRPYGPKGERICFQCGMKNEAATTRQFRRSLGEDMN